MEVVRRTYPDAEEEVLIDRFYVVDIYVPSLKLILEVQGPDHFTENGKSRIKTIVKKKLLNKLGYKVRGLHAMNILSRVTLYSKEIG